MQNQEDIWEEDCAFTDEDSDEATFSQDSFTTEGMSGWETLPNVCLQHVFRFLPDGDRSMASLVCHHWHNVMHSPCLWRTRFFNFSGRLSKYRPSEYNSAVGYVRSLGVYLKKLEVCVCPPRTNVIAQRLEETICGLLFELVRVKAPLQFLSLVCLKLDRSSWDSGHRNILVDALIYFLRNGASKLRSVCLNGMRNDMQQGLKLLSALSEMHCYISSLDLRGFFSTAVSVHPNPSMPHFLQPLQGLTDLGLSYCCLSDELLMVLQQRHSEGRWTFGRNILQRISLHCTQNESHQQLVHSSSWAGLASHCPDLNIKLTVDQVINNDCLARMLVPGIPLREYSMTALYTPNENWSPKPLLCDMLPQYRHSLQILTLDLSNCSESLDEELLELVNVCEHLVDLRVWAFLEILTVGRLLQIRLNKKLLLNKIKVRIYTMNDNKEEQEDQLEEMLYAYQQNFPPELTFFAAIYPFI
ncbi:F-box only protein 39-like [Melanotaenia boesemani]|uniref:F-box only protein 39-like n=1 Tax=Melanotaenia boesemani TaxID=1250792 RepID=UPI001C043279|nr:F-box only protein 39-like [Melanotaenia boesemani]